jgi:glutathione S-transferase
MPARPAQPIKVYSTPLSGHAHRVRLLLSLLDLPHELIEVDIPGGANRRPEFLAKNPLGEIPVIEDGDVVIYDSNAILVYLATRYDDGKWLPRDPIAAATVQRWLGLAAGPIAFGPNRARLAALFKAPVDPAQAKAVAERLLGNLNRELAGKSFALGESASLADVAAYSYIAVAPEGGVSLAPYPNVRAWLARVEALPRFTPMHRSITATA